MEKSKVPVSLAPPAEKSIPSTLIICASKSKTTVVKLKPSDALNVNTSYETRLKRQASSKPLPNGVYDADKSSGSKVKRKPRNVDNAERREVREFDAKRKEVREPVIKVTSMESAGGQTTSIIEYLCSECPNLTFYSRSDWRDHDNHHKFKCEHCDKSFSRPGKLAIHVRRHFGDKPYACDLCDKKFVSTKDLKNHKKVHSDKRDLVCEICGETFKYKTSFANHKKKHNGDLLPCDLCEKKCVSKSHLEQHRRRHTGERPFKCDKCGKVFTHQSGLKSHKMYMHSGVSNSYMCDICGKTFSIKSNYRNHCRVHTAIRSYMCDVCGYSFKSSINLKQHKLVHESVKPFICKFCGKGFNRKHRMREHETRYHGDEMATTNVVETQTPSIGGDLHSGNESEPEESKGASTVAEEFVDRRRVALVRLEESEGKKVDKKLVQEKVDGKMQLQIDIK